MTRAMSVSVVCTLSFFLTVVCATVPVKLGMVFEAYPKVTPVQKYHLLPAAQIAMATVARRLADGDFADFEMTSVVNKSCCNRPVDSTGEIASSLHDQDVDAFLGPAYSYGMRTLAGMAANWNLPVISGGSLSNTLLDTMQYKTLTRTGMNSHSLTKFILAIFDHFRWQNCAIVRGLTESYYYQNIFSDDVLSALEGNGIAVTEVYTTDVEQAILNATAASNVIILSTSPVKDIMIQAHRLGYTGGNHTFLYSYPSEFAPWQTKSQFEDLDDEAVAALGALMIMRFQVPDTTEYHVFQEELKNRTIEMYGLMEFEVINEIVAEGGNVRDGSAVTQKLWSHTFQGVTGAVNIGDNGDHLWMLELLDVTDGIPTIRGTYNKATDELIMTE